MKAFFQKGQISLFVAITGALGMIGASFITSWATIGSKVGGVENRVSIVEERENNHYSEIQKQLNKIDSKLEMLLNKK